MYDIEGFLDRQFEDSRPYGSPITDLRVDCPFCIERVGKHDIRYKLFVSIQKQVVHCFRCDYSANWWKFVKDVIGSSNYVEIFSELYVSPPVRDFQRLQDEFTGKQDTVSPLVRFDLPGDFQGLWSKPVTVLLKKAKSYAKKRGFGKSYWKRYNLGVAASVGWRLIIPIEDNYWQARSLFKDHEPKYINPKAETGHYVFNNTALEIYDEIVICEGAFSAMSVGSNAIALIRKKATTEQVDRLVKCNVKKVILTVEPGAFTAMDYLADMLRKNDKEVTLWWYDEGDPNDQDAPDKVMEYNLRNRVEALLTVK